MCIRDRNIEVPWSVEIEFDGKFQHSREFVDQAVKKSFDYLQSLIAVSYTHLTLPTSDLV